MIFYFLCMNVYLHVGMCTECIPGACGEWGKVLGPLGLQLLKVVS